MPVIRGMYAGIDYTIAPINTPAQIQAVDDYLNNLVSNNKQDIVVSIFVAPTAFVDNAETSEPVHRFYTLVRNRTIDGYTPRNLKLLTYPYNYVAVDTLNEAHNYRFEYSHDQNNQLTFFLIATMSPNFSISVVPFQYNMDAKPGTGWDRLNWTESVEITGFPQAAFTIDSFRAWLAQHAVGDVIGIAGQGIGTIGNFASGNVAGGVLGMLGIASSINSAMINATQGSKARGNQGSSNAQALGAKAATFKRMSITAEYARMIDDFFDRYGYSCCKIKKPNRNVRPHWTYTKTRDCNITGHIPADDMAKIKSIYNNGITFWKIGSEVGNYGQNNSIAAG